MSEYCKNCFELQNKIDELGTEKEQLQALCDVYKVCYMAKHKGKTEIQIIDEFVMHFS